MASALQKWMEESVATLELMDRERQHHEMALDAAMSAIRSHTAAVERIERDMEIIRNAVEQASEEVEAQPEPVAAPAPRPPAPTAPPRARSVLQPPPLRPVPRAI